MLYGFSQVIFQGALVTLELALSSVVLAVLIGLAGAGAKLSNNRPLALIFEGYTTLIRGVPDLVLMLLIFYGLQIALNGGDHHAGLYLRGLLHRNLSRRLPGGAKGTY